MVVESATLPNFRADLHLSPHYDDSGNPMRMYKIFLPLLLLFTATSGAADTLQYATANGAIDGYDPVSYFTDGAAKRGSPDKP
jgi:hypothetical protein